jgi:hypothetical protein
MSAATSTTFDALLKQIWPQSDIYDLLYENMPAYALVRKSTDFFEKIRNIAVGFGATQGAGADFTMAKNSKAASKEVAFQVTTVSYYSLFSVTRKLIRQSQNKRGAIAAALERESTLALKTWKRDMGILLFGNGGGALGTVSSGQTTGTVTLGTTSDVRKFEIGMTLQVSSDDGSPTSPAGVRTGFVTVKSVDRLNGTVTITSGNWNDPGNIPAVAGSDSIFRAGNYAGCIKGFSGWLPSSNPTGGDSWFAIDRSQDPFRLGGVRKTVTGLSPREGLMTAAMEGFNNGGAPTHEFRHTADYLNLQLELQSSGNLYVQKEMAEKPGDQVFGMPFEGVMVMGPTGPIKIFPDYNCTQGTSYMLQFDTWTLAGTGDFPYIDAQDGNRILREESADAYEGRIVGDLQLYCEAPGYNVRVTL